MLNDFLSLSGSAACLWIVIGVLIAANKYPGYNHKMQFLSELGASGSPTQKLSPRVNNFPLAILFFLFGFYLYGLVSGSLNFKLMGLCIIAHGVGTFVAGVFPMDADPFTKEPSRSGKIHALAGMIMFLSLLLAPVIGLFNTFLDSGFKVFSGVCIVLTLYISVRLARAFSTRGTVGLYQRLSYAVQLLWLSCLSCLVFLQPG